MELRLVANPHGAGDVQWKWYFRGELRGQPEAVGDLGLPLDGLETVAIGRIRVVVAPPEVAVETERPRDPVDDGDPVLVGRGVCRRALAAGAAHESVVCQAVQRGELRARMAGGAASHAARL